MSFAQGRQAGSRILLRQGFALLAMAYGLACSSQDGTTGQIAAAIAPPPVDGGADATQTSSSPTATSGPLAPYTAGSFQLNAGGGLGYVIGVGDASPWVVGTDFPTHIYHYNNDSPPPRVWNQEANSANTSSLAVSPEGTPWKIDTSGYVSERTAPGTWATRGSSFLAWEVSVGRTDNAWAISRNGCTRDGNFIVIDCPIFQWASGQWVQHSGMGRHIAVAPDGTTYMTNSVGTIYKFDGSSFVQWGSGRARDRSHGDALGWPVIAAASNDSVWVIGDSGSGADYPIYAWLAQANVWQQIPGAATTISVGADGTPWVINSAKNIFEYVTSWQPMGPFGFSFPSGIRPTRGRGSSRTSRSRRAAAPSLSPRRAGASGDTFSVGVLLPTSAPA